MCPGEPERVKALARDIAYHGITLGALSLTGVPRGSWHRVLDGLPVVLLADCCVPFLAAFLSAIAKHLSAQNESQPLDLRGG